MNTEIIEKTRDFAHRAHDAIQQKRKYTGEPYWVHTDEVALIVTNAISPIYSSIQEYMIAAAHLHDYLEDVETKLLELGRFDELEAYHNEYLQFPEMVRAFVADLTDVYTSQQYPNYNRATRKRLEVDRIAKTSRFSKTIKLADLISNTKSIVDNDSNFARTYIKEKLSLLKVLDDGNQALYNEALRIAREAADKLGIKYG